jgi:hypothetical protein
MRSGSKVMIWVALALGATVPAAAAPLASTAVKAPMTCSRGPNIFFIAAVAVPRTAEQGSIYTIRIDGVPSGKIEHFGLHHIHDMVSDYAIPPGAKYVPGSARVIPDTGTPNVSGGARVSYEAGVIRSVLTDTIPAGGSYTPPAIEFQLEAAAPAGASLTLQLLGYRVTANAVILGDVLATCEPVPKQYALGTTIVTAAGSH